MDYIQHLDTAAAVCLGASSGSVLHAGQGTRAQGLLEMETNLSKVSSIIITEKAPRDERL